VLDHSDSLATADDLEKPQIQHWRNVSATRPRRDRWADHFAWEGTVVAGRTAIGRATVGLLTISDWQRLEVRENLQTPGEPFAR